MRTDRDHALALDAADPLARFREAFVAADPGLVYLDGNSLGRLPAATERRLAAAVRDEWGARLVRGWGEGWYEAPRRIGAKIARLVGAGPDEVIVSDSTSVNLWKLLVAALVDRADRTVVVTDDLNFPSDLYLTEGAVRLLGAGRSVRLVRSRDGIGIDAGDLAAAIDGDVAVVALTQSAFKSGFLHDLPEVTARAHDAGALVLWDLSHSAGAVPIDLDGTGADLAVGCTYKYLNGGPGSPAFLFVRRGLQERLRNPLTGWFGHDRPFDFDLTYAPAPGLTRFLAGTPPVLSLLGIEGGVDLLLEAGIEAVREKSVRQTEYLVALWEERLAPLGVALRSPRDPARRGSHVSLGHPDGLRVDRALIEEMGVIPDFRAPDNIRFAVAPLYNSFVDVWEAVERLRRVLFEGRHERYPAEPPAVT